MEATGILLKKVNERQGVSQNGVAWKRADYILQTEEMFPKHICFSVADGQVGRFAQFDSMLGKEVTVMFNVDAREYNGRWYNDVQAYGIRLMAGGATADQG